LAVLQTSSGWIARYHSPRRGKGENVSGITTFHLRLNRDLRSRSQYYVAFNWRYFSTPREQQCRERCEEIDSAKDIKIMANIPRTEQELSESRWTKAQASSDQNLIKETKR
jgi:hypothetical protein